MPKSPKWLTNLKGYLKGHPYSLIVYLSFAVFLALWGSRLLGSYSVAMGTVIGSIAIAVSSLSPGNTLDKWVIAAIGTGLVGICAYIDTAEQLKVSRLKSELEKDIQSYTTPPDRKREYSTFLDGRLHDCVNTVPVDVDRCEDLIALWEHIDGVNGGISYFKAEMFRIRGRLRDSDDHLYNYIEQDKRRRPAGVDDGSAFVCDANGTGYCSQRTAWVCHTLANDLVRSACDAVGSGQRSYLFGLAQEKYNCSRNWSGGSFEQHLHTRPFNTADLGALLENHLKHPLQRCPAPPGT